MSTSAASSGLSPAGMLDHQLRHFAEHGWVLLEGVLSPEQCQAYVDAIDRGLEYYHSPHNSETVSWLSSVHLQGNIYLDWFTLPGIVEVNRQLMGVPDPHVCSTDAVVTAPHPDRKNRREELLDRDEWGWHRDFGPSACLIPNQDDANLVTGQVLVNITFLTPASAENGSSAALDGSHRLDGDYELLKDRCPIVQAEGPAGSVFILPESLIHSAVPVVSETTRYALIHKLSVPWFVPTSEIPQKWARDLRDEQLRSLFSPPRYGEPKFADV